MLNRVFSSDAPIELEIIDPVQPSSPPTQTPTPATEARRPPALLPIVAAAAGLTSALVMAVAWGLWNQQQQVLRQERNLVLLERLRSLGPGSPTPAAAGSSACRSRRA